MRKLFNRLSLCFLSSLFLIAASCDNGKDEGKTEAVTSTDNTSTNKQTASTPALVGGTLDTLSMAASDFPGQGPGPVPRMVFSFTIDATDELKLHGWNDKGGANQFDPVPNYQLNNGGQHNGGTYGPNMYFGNIVIAQSDVAKIRNKINQGNYTTVLFVPKIVNTNHIGYDIFVGKPGAQIIIMAVDPTNVEANPSPPRNY
jgi:hypothetical protein